MTTPIKSLFECLPPAYQLPPEPLPTKVIKTYFVDGKKFEIPVDRKTKGAKK